jgi:hypothetical protein
VTGPKLSRGERIFAAACLFLIGIGFVLVGTAVEGAAELTPLAHALLVMGGSFSGMSGTLLFPWAES